MRMQGHDLLGLLLALLASNAFLLATAAPQSSGASRGQFILTDVGDKIE